ncbi:MAG: cytidylyltransferase domain-containing protein [Microthrixaceae bacterium]
MRVLIVIQARTGSTRFPRKVLMDIAGQPMLGFMLDRLAPLAEDLDTDIVVATTDRAQDQDIVDLARAKSVATVRGSEHDVLGRFVRALDRSPAEVVVRLTADCPLMDPQLVRTMLDTHATSGADYTSNTLARTYPDGLDVEVMAAEALRRADKAATSPDEREHVTPHLQRHPRRFQLAQHLDHALAGDERWTVDTPDDFHTIESAIATIEDPSRIGWRDLLQHIGRTADPTRPRAIPIAGNPHARGAPYARLWFITRQGATIGSASATVDEGGIASLEIDSAEPEVVEEAVRTCLRADLQVTQLTTTTGANT